MGMTLKYLPDVKLTISKSDLCWLAGLLEGEGSFRIATFRNTKYGIYKYPQIRCAMTDEDVVMRCHQVTSFGTVTGPHSPPSRAGRKPTWIWSVDKTKQVIELMNHLLPYMGTRRAEQIR